VREDAGEGHLVRLPLRRAVVLAPAAAAEHGTLWPGTDVMIF
jgi:hypothetical protein